MRKRDGSIGRRRGAPRAVWIAGLCLALWACDDGGGSEGDLDGAGGAGGSADLGTDVGADAVAPDAEAGPGVPAVDETRIAFGPVAVRGRGEGTLVVRNTGESAFQITGFEGLAAPFSSARMPPISVPPGAERSLILVFEPQAVGPVEQVFTLQTDVAGAAPIAITLTADAVQPEGALVEGRLDFGVVVPGTPAARFIEVQNLSDVAPLTVNAVTGLSAPFAVAPNQVPTTAQPGALARVLVQFDTAVEGDFEQAIVVQTNAGDFDAVVVGRAVAVGDLSVRGVEPAWAPTDEAAVITVHGGPFEAVPAAITVGGVALTDLTLVDAERVKGILPADAAAALGPQDVRVEVGARFGVGPAVLVRTPAVADGAVLDGAALAAGPIGPEGNPWRLELEAVAEGETLQVAAGTVILASGEPLQVAGALRMGGEGGPVVFSTAERLPGGWGGLALAANDAPSDLTGVVLEYAGFDGHPALALNQAANLNRLTVRQCADDGVRVGATGTLSLLGGEFTDLGGDAVNLLTPTGGIFRLNDARVRRADWALAAHVTHFGQRPLGTQDWAQNRHEGIGLGGALIGAATLSNQPDGVRYHVREPIEITADSSLALASAAPLTLDGALRVRGTFTVPAGLTVQAAPGGKLVVKAGGTLTARGGQTEADRIVVQARAGEAAAPGQWEGLFLEPGGTLDVENLTLRDGGATPSPEPDLEGAKGEPVLAPGANLHLAGAFGILRGVWLEGSAQAGMIVGADGSFLNGRWAANGDVSVRVTGGTGRISGVTEDAAVPAMAFEPVDLCGAWELPAFRFPDMSDAPTNCPQ